MLYRFDRSITLKPGTLGKVMEIAPKMSECAKKILGDDMGENLKFQLRLGSGPFHEVRWSWEFSSLDLDLANQSKLMQNEEWIALGMQIVPHVHETSSGDSIWTTIHAA